MPRYAYIFACADITRPSGEPLYWAEVIANPSSVDEATLYATTWYATRREAIADALAWMEDNGVEDADP